MVANFRTFLLGAVLTAGESRVSRREDNRLLW
jgi:hypothetical protein